MSSTPVNPSFQKRDGVNEDECLLDYITMRSEHIPTSVRGISTLTPTESLEIYRSDYLARLQGALTAHYPLTKIVLGDPLFDEITEAYVLEIPSTSWNLIHYGHQFSSFLSDNLRSLLLQDFPFIEDLATLEWNIHEFFHEPSPPTPPAFETAPSEGFIEGLKLSENLRFFSSAYSIPALHRLIKTSEQNWRTLSPQPSYYFLAKTPQQFVQFYELTPISFQILTYWKQNKELGKAMENLEHDKTQTNEDLSAYLETIPTLLSQIYSLGFIETPKSPL